MTADLRWVFRVAAAVSILAVSSATYSYFANIGNTQLWAVAVSVLILASISLMLWTFYEFAHSAGYQQGYDRGFQDAFRPPELANGEAPCQDRIPWWIQPWRRRDALIARAAKLFTRHKESEH